MPYRRTNVDCLDPITSLLFLVVGYCVRHNQLLQLATIQLLNGVAAQDAVGYYGNRFPSSVLHNDIGGFDECAARVGHIVHDDSHAVAHITDQYHAGDFVWSCALFVD